MKRSFKEIRLHKDKPLQEFLCDLLHQEKDYLVLQYVSPQSARINGIYIREGTITIAHYWEKRNYVLWKFKHPDDGLKGYLFHICNTIKIGKNFVEYEDLELDIWCDPDENVTVLDQDEVNDCFKRGLLDTVELSLIAQQKKEILNGFQHILKTVWSEEGIS